MDQRPQGYLFESRPHAVKAGRQKFRDQPAQPRKNLMYDKRVVRGNTYAPGNIFSAEGTQRLDAAERTEQMRQAQARARAKAQQKAAEEAILTTPGRVSVPVQTDAYLEDLIDQAFQAEQGSQTDPDPSLRRKPPVFKKKKMGVSMGTSIMPGDLFDFNLSIEPILEVIVGKCLDQGSMEVIQEQSMKLIKAHHEEYKSRKNAMIAESKRLSTESLRRYEAKEDLLKQRRAQFEREQNLAYKVASRNLSIRFMAGLQNLVLGRLEKSEFLQDPAKHQVKTQFIPWLNGQVALELLRIQKSHEVIDTMLMRTRMLADAEVKEDEAQIAAVLEKERLRIQNIKDERSRLEGLRLDREAEDKKYADDLAAALKAIEDARIAAQAAAKELEDQESDSEDD